MQERSSQMVYWLIGGAVLAGVIYASLYRRVGRPAKPTASKLNQQVNHWRLQVSGDRPHRVGCRCQKCSNRSMNGRTFNGNGHHGSAWWRDAA